MNLASTITLIPNLWQKFPVIKNFFFLISAGVFAQALSLLFIPILAHFYEPYAFGIWANIIALGVISNVSSLRFELGIVLAKSDRTAIHIIILSLFLNFLVTCIYISGLYIFSGMLSAFIQLPNLEHYIHILFMYIFGTGLYQIFLHWLIRNQQYKSISFFRVTQSILIFIFQMLFYFLSYDVNGLILGTAIGMFLLSFSLVLYCLRCFPSLLKNTFNSKHMFASIYSFKNFALYTTPYSLGGQAFKSLIVFMTTRFFGIEAAGYYSISIRLIQSPMNLILQTLSQTFLPEFSTKAKLLRGQSQIQKIMVVFAWISGFLMAIGFVFMEDLIFYLFGSKWSKSAEICVISLIPFTLLIFEGWIDRSYDIIKKQKVMLIQDVAFNVLSILCFIVVASFTNEFLLSLFSMNIVILIYYFFWIFLLFYYLRFSKIFLFKMLSKYYLWMFFNYAIFYYIKNSLFS